MTEAMPRAARIQAKHIVYNHRLPEKMDYLWGKAINFACHFLNLADTTASPGMKSPYET